MSYETDPARELTDLCLRIRQPEEITGANFLAVFFEVEEWSTDFVNIISLIHNRIENLKVIIGQVDIDDDIKALSVSRLNTLRRAFIPDGTQNVWSYSCKHFLSDEILLPIRMSSAYIRPHYGYQVVSGEELDKVISDLVELLGWLRELELGERDFIRSVLIEGIEQVIVRLKKIGIYGWSETFISLREVISAYMALLHDAPAAGESTTYEAMVKRTGIVLKSILDKIKFAKDVKEAGEWVLQGYGALTVIGHFSAPIAGLIAFKP